MVVSNPASDVARPAIVATNLRRIDKAGWLQGSVDLWIPQWKLHIHGVLWGKSPNGQESVVLPDKEYTASDGSTRRQKILTWGDSATAERFRLAALAAIHALAAAETAP